MQNNPYYTGAHAAFMKFGLDDTSSSPYSIEYQQPTSSSDGQAAAIDQAFDANAQLGEDGQAGSQDDPASSFVSAVNNSLQPGAPPSPEDLPRRFDFPTDQSGGDL